MYQPDTALPGQPQQRANITHVERTARVDDERLQPARAQRACEPGVPGHHGHRAQSGDDDPLRELCEHGFGPPGPPGIYQVQNAGFGLLSRHRFTSAFM
jgi:hypothetical protein